MLEVSNLHSFYGDTQVLHGIDVTVGDQARVAIVGRNGAGKSTLLKSIMNAGPQIRGRILWNKQELGKASASDRARRGLCLVPEDRRIFPNLTVLENVMMGQTAAPADGRWKPHDLLARFPLLEPLAGRMGGQLSGGQQQMLAIARGFASAPKLMLLDEPTEGLAPVVVNTLAKAIPETCKATSSALVLCEQNISFAKRVTDYVLVMHSGEIAFRGNWDAFDADPTVKTRYLAV